MIKKLWNWVLSTTVGDALFGNTEDGYYGDLGFNPEGSTSTWTAVRWWLKNPIHNFTWHVIGVTGKEFTRTGKYPKDVFAPVGNFNWAVINYNGWKLPFVAYQGALGKFYIGWRERGAFGIKLNRYLLVGAILILAAEVAALIVKYVL